MKYLFLLLAVVLEVIGSSFLQASNQFTKLIPSVLAVVVYMACFYCFTLALKEMPLGIAYAIWGGLGIVLTALVSVFVFKQQIDLPAILGIALIVCGVFVLNVFSKTTQH